MFLKTLLRPFEPKNGSQNTWEADTQFHLFSSGPWRKQCPGGQKLNAKVSEKNLFSVYECFKGNLPYFCHETSMVLFSFQFYLYIL